MHGFKKFYEDLSNSKEKNETFHSNYKKFLMKIFCINIENPSTKKIKDNQD